MRLSLNISAHIMTKDENGDQLRQLLTEIVPEPHPKFPQLFSSRSHVKCVLRDHLQSAIVEFCLMNGLAGVNVVVDSALLPD